MLTLRVTWRSQNQREEEFPLGGPVRNRLLYLAVVLKRKKFLWTLVCVEMELLHQACGI